MKVFETEGIRSIDEFTINQEGISSKELISRVAEGVAAEIVSRWRPSRHMVIFAGPGNNGADAVATAMVLLRQGYRPNLYLFNIGGDSLSKDCKAMRDEMRRNYSTASFFEITEPRFMAPEINSNTLVVDGLFGSGLRGPLQGGFMSIVRYINESKATVVSIDVPSGMCGEWNSHISSRNIIHATLTLGVQMPRIAFFLSDNAELVGEWKLLDIGLSQEAIRQTPTKYHFVEGPEVSRLLRRRPEFSSKRDFGSACLVAGRYGMVGAAVLACRGAVRAGAGKVTLYGPQCEFEVIQSSVPEVLFTASGDKILLSEINLDGDYNAIGIGPGLGTSESTVEALCSFLKRTRKPLVLDADALNCIAAKPAMLNDIPEMSVITPHAGEFDRLFGVHTSDESRLLKAIEVAAQYKICVLLKNRYSMLVRPDGRVYFNSSGCPGLATAGSGDVLTGVITAFMAQGYKPDASAMLGAYVHGLAGELAEKDHGSYGVTASDVAANVGKAINKLMQSTKEGDKL